MIAPLGIFLTLILNLIILLVLIFAGVIPLTSPDVSKPCEPESRQARCLGR